MICHKPKQFQLIFLLKILECVLFFVLLHVLTILNHNQIFNIKYQKLLLNFCVEYTKK